MVKFVDCCQHIRYVSRADTDVSVYHLHDDGRHIDVGLDRLVRQDATTVDINFIANSNVVAKNCDVLQASPTADSAVPAHNGGLDASVILDLGATQQHTVLQADAVADNDVRSDSDIGADSAVLANLGRRINENVSAVDEGLSGRCQGLAAAIG